MGNVASAAIAATALAVEIASSQAEIGGLEGIGNVAASGFTGIFDLLGTAFTDFFQVIQAAFTIFKQAIAVSKSLFEAGKAIFKELIEFLPSLIDLIDIIIKLIKKGIMLAKMLLFIAPFCAIIYYTTYIIQLLERRY